MIITEYGKTLIKQKMNKAMHEAFIRVYSDTDVYFSCIDPIVIKVNDIGCNSDSLRIKGFPGKVDRMTAYPTTEDKGYDIKIWFKKDWVSHTIQIGNTIFNSKYYTKDEFLKAIKTLDLGDLIKVEE